MSEATGMEHAYIFHHIPKCAGSSLVEILKLRFPNAAYPAYSLGEIRELTRIPASSRDICIFGHAAWGCHEYLGDHFVPRYFTFLRTPLDRFLSNYHFERKMKHFHGSIEEYFEENRKNLMVHYLGGDLERARERLFHTFSCFGLAEAFPLSLAHMGERLGLDLGPEVFVNVREGSPPQIADELKARILAANAEDMALYDEAVAVFRERTSGHPSRHEVQRPAPPSPAKVVPSKPILDDDLASRPDAIVRELLKAESWDGTSERLMLIHFSALAHLQRLGHEAMAEEILRSGYAKFPMEFAYKFAMLAAKDNPSRAVAVLKEFMETIDPLRTTSQGSWVNEQYAMASNLRALLCERLDDPEEAEKAYRAFLELRPKELLCVQRLAALLRKQGRYAECRDLFEALLDAPDGPDAKEIRRELAVTAYQMGREQEVLALMAEAPEAREMDLLVPEDRITSLAGLPRDRGILVVNTAPAMVHDAFARRIVPLGMPVFLLSPTHALDRLQHPVHVAVYAMPESRFEYETDCRALDPELFTRCFDAVVILMSRYDLEDYRSIIRLARDLSAPGVYCFAMDFMDSARLGQSVCHLPDDVGGDAAPLAC